MKKIFTLSFILCALAGFAQIPSGYYSTATGTGYTLKTQLHNIIDNHTDKGYSGLYTTFALCDKDLYYENNGSILDIYSEKPSGPDNYEYYYGSSSQDDGSGGTQEGQKFNREHIIPQSYFDSETPMYSDAHFIVPTDKYVNAQRNNLPFGRVNSANYTSTNGTKRGSNLNSGYSAGYTATVFEPIDEFKGDVARMFFYFVTRYEGQLGDFYTATNASSTEAKAMFDGTEDHAFSTTFLNILLTWHNQDPVSQRETDRNNAIYGRQDNRNPFIDHPEYAQSIWGNSTGLDALALANLAIYPNPSVNHEVTIYTEVELTEIQLVNLNGQLVQQISTPNAVNHSYTLSNLPQGFYLLKVTAGDSTATKKVIVN